MTNRTVYKMIGRILKVRNWLFRPTTFGVRALITNADGEILLVRHSYGRHWYLPGGGHSGTETLTATLKRELDEELGLSFGCSPKLLGVYSNHFEYKKDFVAVFVVEEFDLQPKVSSEVEEWGFFRSTQLPADTSPGTRRRVHEFTGERTLDFVW
jgi:ADP-ribose pyrophosphatase YjhB (NUDIX family)